MPLTVLDISLRNRGLLPTSLEDAVNRSRFEHHDTLFEFQSFNEDFNTPFVAAKPIDVLSSSVFLSYLLIIAIVSLCYVFPSNQLIRAKYGIPPEAVFIILNPHEK